MEVTNSGVKAIVNIGPEDNKLQKIEPQQDKATAALSTDKITLSDDLIMTMGTGGGTTKPPPTTEN